MFPDGSSSPAALPPRDNLRHSGLQSCAVSQGLGPWKASYSQLTEDPSQALLQAMADASIPNSVGGGQARVAAQVFCLNLGCSSPYMSHGNPLPAAIMYAIISLPLADIPTPTKAYKDPGSCNLGNDEFY